MATAGFVFLVLAFAASLAAGGAFAVGHVAYLAALKKADEEREGAIARANAVARIGRIATIAVAAALFVCCAILVFCFFTGDVSILYVLQERSLSTSSLAWLYKLSGLWAGRAGSLLFWVFLIALFAVALCAKARRAARSDDAAARLDHGALAVMNAVMVLFLGVLVFSQSNMPFVTTPAHYFTADGSLSSSASLNSMNSLLEHWAMAIHPPTLFIGYAGMTVPFAYAIAAVVTGDASRLWVQRATRYLLFSWLFLGVGIGLGAVWAYVVLGWGGYWGWDPVENASLLSWLVGVALIHTFTVYRQRGAFKRWAVMCACLAFAFVIVGTFISRSGIVQSVHAFEGDPVSLALFGALIVLSVLAGVVGLALRWKTFASDVEGGDDVENMLSKDAAYYFNNVIMIVFTLLLTYMTVASALPTWMPFGGESLSTTSYDAIARPLGIVYLFILAICPLLSWGKTDPKAFFKQARIPGLCALVLFAALLAYYFTALLPAYRAMLAQGTSLSMKLAEAGPEFYYVALSLVGLLVASLLFFNALFMLCRGVKRYAKAHSESIPAALVGTFRNHPSTYGGFVSHLAMSIILVGLIGSAMYVTEVTGYMPYDADTDTAQADFTIQEYTLKYAGSDVTTEAETYTAFYQVDFDVYRDGNYIGRVHPQVQANIMTQQQKLNASVISFPDEDLFVVYRGVNANGAFSLDVRVNPLIQFVWVGFALLMVGVVLALIGRRDTQATGVASVPKAVDAKRVSASSEVGE